MSFTNKRGKPRSIPFFFIFIITFLLLIATLFFVWRVVFRVSDEDFHAYHSLMEEANPTLSDKTQKAPYTAIQDQKGVRKDIYFYRGLERLHCLLECDHVDASLYYHHGKTELTEQLQNVKGCIQDSFYKDRATHLPMQKVYYCVTDNLSINYQKNSFIADNIKLTSRVISGRTIDGNQEAFDTQAPSLLDISACKALYNGKNIQLEKDVLLHSPTVTATANFATAAIHYNVTQDKDLPIKKNLFDTIELQDNVVIDYHDELKIFADHARYMKTMEGYGPQSWHQFPGKIVLEGKDLEHRCRIISKNGDEVTSPAITIDTNSKLVQMQDTKGIISTHSNALSSKQVSYPLIVNAQQLLWDLNRDSVFLKDHSTISQESLGFLTNDGEVVVYYSGPQGKKSLRAMTSTGHTVLCKVEDLEEHSHWLVCDGKMVVDHEKMEAEWMGEVDHQGKVIAGKQVFFYDHLGEVQADKMVVSYSSIGGKFFPKKVVFEGNVYWMDHQAVEDDVPNDPLHYALANKAEYIPETRQIYLSSKSGSRVLFYDKMNSLRVSAPALKVIRDQQTKKEKIQGEGDVRFHFINAELELLQKRVNLNF